MLYNPTKQEIERFEKRCYRDNEGILRWGGSIDKTKGHYGVFRFRGKIVYAHRFAFDIWGDAELRDSDCVLHKIHGIENRNIIDVRHLYLGSNTDNVRDAVEAERVCRGEDKPNAIFTNEQVLDIYRRAWSGEKTTTLAMKFGTRKSDISSIKHGHRWSWLTGHQKSAMAAD